MSIKFNNLKTAYGLDDVLVFPRHRDKTVYQILQDDPRYIQWLMKNTDNYFYESVHEELDRQLARNTAYDKPRNYPNYTMSKNWYTYDQRGLSDFDDYFDDIPF